MADDKDPLKQLKDLTQLKNQLEEIQRRVEREVSAGIPQGGSVLASPFVKGFLAGYVVARLRSSAFLGVLLGTVTGMYAAQNYQVPNIERTFKEYMNNLKKGPNSPARIKRQWVKRIKWSVLLGLMVLIYGSHAPLITLTKVDGQVPFNPSSCIVMIELAKLLISLVTLVLTGGTSALHAAPGLAFVAPYAVPAILYALNNNLVVLMQVYMDPSSFQVLSNLKIASTALIYSFCLGKRLRPAQWLGLGLLMLAGVFHSYSSLDIEKPDRAEAEEVQRLHITAWGLFLVLLYCCVSGLAAVYTEGILKSQKLSLSLQNLCLYMFGVAINGLSSFFSVASDKGFLEGYSWVVWVIIAGQAANGLLMSVVLKHGSGITRLFVISCSMLVNALLSWAILGLQLTSLFPVPVTMIGLAAYLYYR